MPRTAVLATLALLLPGTLAFAAPAHAAGGLITCTGTVTDTYSPPLGPLPQPTSQRVVERLGADGGGACTGPLAGAIATTVFDQQVGCLAQGLGDTLVTNVVTYRWDDDETSTITYPVTTVAHVADQLVVASTGTVTSGFGRGAVSERIAAYPDLDVVKCLTSGVGEQTGLLTVAIG